MSNKEIITEPSICIPRTLNNVTWRQVKDTFETLLGKGTVDRVDIPRRRDDDSQFIKIFVHLRYWPVDNEDVAAWRQTLLDGGEIKVVHQHPWFWKCVASRLPKPENRNAVSCKPYVMGVQKAPDTPTVADHLPEQHLQEETSEEV